MLFPSKQNNSSDNGKEMKGLAMFTGPHICLLHSCEHLYAARTYHVHRQYAENLRKKSLPGDSPSIKNTIFLYKYVDSP